MAEINEDVRKRCQVIHDSMMLQWRSTAENPAPIQGVEREIFVGDLLSIMIPPHHRVGTGVIVDSFGHRSTQTDIVVEYPYGIRFPIGTGNTSLFLAESVALAIEVKSNFTKQWKEVKEKTLDTYRLRRRRVPKGQKAKHEIIVIDRVIPPLFVVSYAGPKKIKTLEKRLAELPRGVWPAGILIIESGLYMGKSPSGWLEAKGPAESIFAFMMHVSEWMRYDVADTWNLGHYLDLTPGTPPEESVAATA